MKSTEALFGGFYGRKAEKETQIVKSIADALLENGISFHFACGSSIDVYLLQDAGGQRFLWCDTGHAADFGDYLGCIVCGDAFALFPIKD